LRAVRRRLPWSLFTLLALATGLSVCWNVALPPLQGPDEIEHIAYVEAIGAHGTIPWTAVRSARGRTALPADETVAASASNLADLRANPGARAPASTVDVASWRQADAAIRGGVAVGSVASMSNPPLAYLYLTPWYLAASDQGFFARAFVLRLANIPLLLIVIAATWGLLGLAFPARRWLQVLGTGAVAVQPQLIQMSAVVNPDLFLAALWATTLFLGVLLVEQPPTRWRVAAMVLLGIAGPLTHGRGLALAPAAAIALLLSWDRWRGNPGRRSVAKWAVAAVAVGSAAVALLYGTRFSLAPADVRQAASYLWQFYLPRLPFMTAHLTHGYGVGTVVTDRFFSGFASLEVAFSPAMLRAFAWGIAGLAVAAVAGLILQRGAVARHGRAAVFLVLAGVIGVLVLHAAALRSIVGGSGDPVIAGRYLLAFVALYGLAVATAVSWLPGRAGAAVGGALLAALAAIQIGAFGILVERFYA